MDVKILGAGCKKCLALAENVRAAADAASLDVDVEKVTDILEIARFGVMSTPGLVIEGKVVSSGRVLTAQEIGPLLQSA